VKRMVLLLAVAAVLMLALALPASAVDEGAYPRKGECTYPAENLNDLGPQQDVFSRDEGTQSGGLSSHCNAHNTDTSLHEPGSGPAEGATVTRDTCTYNAANQNDTGPYTRVLTPSGEFTQICNAH
jgi:hypothetical protein